MALILLQKHEYTHKFGRAVGRAAQQITKAAAATTRAIIGQADFARGR